MNFHFFSHTLTAQAKRNNLTKYQTPTGVEQHFFLPHWQGVVLGKLRRWLSQAHSHWSLLCEKWYQHNLFQCFDRNWITHSSPPKASKTSLQIPWDLPNNFSSTSLLHSCPSCPPICLSPSFFPIGNQFIHNQWISICLNDRPIRNTLTSCKHPQVWNSTLSTSLGRQLFWGSCRGGDHKQILSMSSMWKMRCTSTLVKLYHSFVCVMRQYIVLYWNWVDFSWVFFACLFLLTCQFKCHAWLQHGTCRMRRHWKTHFWLLGATRSVAASNFCLFDFRIPCLGIFGWVGWWSAFVGGVLGKQQTHLCSQPFLWLSNSWLRMILVVCIDVLYHILHLNVS